MTIDQVFHIPWRAGNLLLKYHERIPEIEIQINNNSNNYVRLVKVDEKDKTLVQD